MLRRSLLTLLAVFAALALVAGCSEEDPPAPQRTGETSTTVEGSEGASGAEPAALDRYRDYESQEYDDPAHWVCRPDLEDICDSDLSTTVVNADGSTEVQEFEPADDAPIDCFYVYPTISRDTTTYSDWEASDEEEGYVTLQQAARLGQVCRVFAPIYRQRTLTSLGERLAGVESGSQEEGDPFADVLDAFRTYMAQDNGGRGVVLIGHSQGSGLLNELLRTEFDPNEDVRQLLVGAYLAGSSVAVPEGEVVGGDLQQVPLCTEAGQPGCVTTWASFRSTAPPAEGSLFGKPREGSGVAGCVNPASVPGGSAELQAYFPSDASASILSSLGTDTEGRTWLEGHDFTTPFVSLPGLVSGECVVRDGYSYLEVTVHGDPADPRADDIAGDLSPEWGLHLVDVNLVMGDVVQRVAEQTEAYAG